MTTATVEGKPVKVGDVVGFKADIEQCGRIAAIKRCELRRGVVVLVVKNPNGFDGEYIGGKTSADVDARDCWIIDNN